MLFIVLNLAGNAQTTRQNFHCFYFILCNVVFRSTVLVVVVVFVLGEVAVVFFIFNVGALWILSDKVKGT